MSDVIFRPGDWYSTAPAAVIIEEPGTITRRSGKAVHLGRLANLMERVVPLPDRATIGTCRRPIYAGSV